MLSSAQHAGGYRGDEEAQLVSARGGQWDTLVCMIL